MATWDPPEITDIAAYLPTRTKNEYGAIQRDGDGKRIFNDTTTPTDDELQQQIDQAVTIVQSDVGANLCDLAGAEEFPEKASELSALVAAMLVELGFFPEQIQRNQSPYPQLKTLYDERRAQLRSEIEEVCGDVPGTGEEPGEGALPIHPPSWVYEKEIADLGWRIVW